MSRTNEKRHIEWHETCKYNCRLDGSVCNNKQRWNKVNAGTNAKNWLIRLYPIKDLFGILVIVSVNMTNHMMLMNIQTMRTVSVERK